MTETLPLDIVASELAAARRRLDTARAHMPADKPLAVQAEWNMRAAVVAETEVALLNRALEPKGEHRLVASIARLLDGRRDTDPFARASADAKREAALRVLRNLRHVLSVEARLELVDQL